MDSNSTAPGEAAGADTENQQASIIAVWVTMTVLATTALCMRFYTRHLILRILGPEDWLILISMEQFYSFLFHTMSLAFTKLSIVFLYLRIMVYGPQRIAVYILLSIIMACNIWVFINNFIQCIPLEALWNSAVKGTCLVLAVTLGNNILHIVTDFLIFILPIPTLIKLNINKKQKAGLLFVFSLGFFVCFISIRLVVISRLGFDDPTYQFSSIAYWGAAEINLAIVCACITTLKPLLVRFFPRLLGSSTTSTSRYGATAGGGTAGRNLPMPASEAARGTKRMMMTVEEREFARLEDRESVKSEEGLVRGYEMEVTRPGRVFMGSKG